MQHIYDCKAGFSNWETGWSSAKKQWCCARQSRGCPGSASGHLTKTVVTHVTTHEGPTYTASLGGTSYGYGGGTAYGSGYGTVRHVHHIHSGTAAVETGASQKLADGTYSTVALA